MKTNLYYTEAMLKKKTLIVLDAVAEELGIVYEEEFGVKSPKKSLVIEAILEKQDKLKAEDASKSLNNPPLHRMELTADEEREFRGWSRRNYVAGQPVDETWHPIVLEECGEINIECGLVEQWEKMRKSVGKNPKNRVAPPTKPRPIAKKVVELEEGEVFCFEGQNKVFMTIRKYVDDKDRPHIVVKTDAPTKSQPAEMDLYYKNHLDMGVLVEQQN